MHVSYYENDCRVGLDIDYHDSDIHVTREDGHIKFSIARRCEGIRVWTELCFNCEQYEHFLCELMRVACGHKPCCDDDDRRERPRRTAELFDQDDCDEVEIDVEVEVERPRPPVKRKINTKGGK